LSQASKSTPPKPMARPAMRVGVRRSLSHTQAITAPNRGVAALKIDDNPAVMDRAA
jgi:hypothetical protein